MKVVGELAVSVLGAALTYVAFTITEDSDPLLRWSVIAATGLVSIIAACLAARSGAAAVRRRRTIIADNVHARGDVEARNVDISSPSDEVRVGTRIRSKGAVRIEGVRVREGDDEDPSKTDA